MARVYSYVYIDYLGMARNLSHSHFIESQNTLDIMLTSLSVFRSSVSAIVDARDLVDLNDLICNLEFTN